MARTRSPDYDNIQESIIQRTARLFATRGYAATSIGDIARACECSKSRLYHYFDSKEAILVAMLTEHMSKLIEGCRDIPGMHEDPVDRFRAMIRFFMEVYAVSGDKHVVLLTCIEFLPPQIRDSVLADEREMVRVVREILAEIRPDIGKDKALSHVDTMLFFGMINWTYTWYNSDGRVSPEQLADRAVDLFLDGFHQFVPPMTPA